MYGGGFATVPAYLADIFGMHAHDAPSKPIYLLLAWLFVGIPLAWGIYRTSLTVAKFF